MTNQERINLIEEAQELVIQAQQLVDEAMEGTDQAGNYEAYGRYGFNQLLGNGNPYDDSLDDLISRIED